MLFEGIMKHPYKKKIDAMCFEDASPSKIASWIRNTVDDDEAIPLDKKIDFYLGEQRIAKYKKFLKEEAGKAISVSSRPLAEGQTESTSKIVLDKSRVLSKIVKKDTQRNIIDLNNTFLNLFSEVQNRLDHMKTSITEDGNKNPYMEKIVQGYIQELRNLLKDYAHISGLESFYQKIGSQAGKQQIHTQLSEKVKEGMKELLRDVLADVDVSKIPSTLERFEKILEQGELEDEGIKKEESTSIKL